MMRIAPGTRVYLACRPVNMRKGFDGLAAEVKAMLASDPFSGQVFVFRSKRGDYVKVLHWDGTGLCLYAKRLEQGRFVWPPILNEGYRMSSAQLELLLEGMDWRRTIAAPLPQRPAIV